jgi:hypothetical protein
MAAFVVSVVEGSLVERGRNAETGWIGISSSEDVVNALHVCF